MLKKAKKLVKELIENGLIYYYIFFLHISSKALKEVIINEKELIK